MAGVGPPGGKAGQRLQPPLPHGERPNPPLGRKLLHRIQNRLRHVQADPGGILRPLIAVEPRHPASRGIQRESGDALLLFGSIGTHPKFILHPKSLLSFLKLYHHRVTRTMPKDSESGHAGCRSPTVCCCCSCGWGRSRRSRSRHSPGSG